jgi:hypothetical protein
VADSSVSECRIPFVISTFARVYVARGALTISIGGDFSKPPLSLALRINGRGREAACRAPPADPGVRRYQNALLRLPRLCRQPLYRVRALMSAPATRTALGHSLPIEGGPWEVCSLG